MERERERVYSRYYYDRVYYDSDIETILIAFNKGPTAITKRKYFSTAFNKGSTAFNKGYTAVVVVTPGLREKIPVFSDPAPGKS